MPVVTVPAAEVEAIREALVSGITVDTSGSTSRPKHVRLSGNALVASARAATAAIGRGGWILALPLTYIAGIMVVARTLEEDTPLVDARWESFDPRVFARLIGELPEGTWFTALVPAQLVRLVDFAEGDTDARDALRRLNRILVGGQATPEGLVERASRLGFHVTRTYGSAETAGGVVYDGRPIGDTVIRISHGDRIEISSSSLADEYVDDPELTAASFVVDDRGVRWWRTTDLGSLTDGVLAVHGRADDVIISGGIKVSLADIDRVLADAGLDAVATWFDDETWGQVPAVVSTTELDREAIRSLIESRLSKESRPYRFATVEVIPRLVSGKIDRRAVRALVEHSQS
ncbi:MAG: AMP-binding protein [Microbacteriaceae bacterium]|nr:AMP-binding protein [Microbacteriaceae bacterium]